MRDRRVRVGIAGFLVLGILLLSGCVKVYQEVTLKAGEEWSAVVKVTFLASTVSQLGEDAITSQQQQFEAQEKEIAAKGVHANIEMHKESNGDVVFNMSFDGKGLTLLNQTVFSGTAPFSDAGNGRVKFHYDAGEMASFAQMGGSYTFILHAGTIYSSNATKTSGGTATWENPTGALDAEFSMGGGGGLSVGAIIGIVVGVLVLLAVIVFVLLYMRGRKPASPPPPPATPFPPAGTP